MEEKNKYEAGLRRYLEAETTLTEEKDLLRNALDGHNDRNGDITSVPQDIDPVGQALIAEKMVFSPVNDEDVMEFDRIISMAESTGHAQSSSTLNGQQGKYRAGSIFLWAGGIAAAAAVTLFAVLPSADDAGAKEESPFETIEIARNIQELMDLGLYEIESITARPERDRIILVATLSDGKEMTYYMTKDPADGSTRLTAMQETINH